MKINIIRNYPLRRDFFGGRDKSKVKNRKAGGTF